MSEHEQPSFPPKLMRRVPHSNYVRTSRVAWFVGRMECDRYLGQMWTLPDGSGEVWLLVEEFPS